ncbi:carbohydate-binding domain-containing protein [Shewanella mesophila]|uniref:family 20 glycosylhydrolase n=1 Tax=Shewanella mesophila TaxID=2864208 RepID=UPI001C65DC91|nr:family 20 glycosylhydrolase [Shewanella mesophila]QYJ85239.1 carbohydate-binding domain-containing protein [Shewanella mesophila]
MNNKLVAVAVMLSLSCVACNESRSQNSDIASQSSSVAHLTQNQLNEFADSLVVTYKTVTNYPEQCTTSGVDGRCFAAQITLTPKAELPTRDWAIYYSQMRPVKQVSSDQFNIKHIKGDLHQITPTDKFGGFNKGQSQTIDFLGELWQLSETDAMPNYYMVVPGLNPAVIKSTMLATDADTGMETRPYAASYTNAETQYKRSDTDRLEWAKPEVLFRENEGVANDPSLAINTIIPTPKIQVLDTHLAATSLKSGYRLSLGDVAQRTVDAALNRLQRLGVNENPDGVLLELKPLGKSLAAGGYQLTILPNQITIYAADDAGYSYGIASLASLIDVKELAVDAMRIEDEPRYAFRGMHVDVARNFHSKQFMLDLIDQMAAYKLNKLHLHMADDEGWRLEIDGLPELTDIGSKRCHDLTEETCLLPQLGSGPSADAKVNGYYTKADYIEILRYASARQVQVIPSMDMPGHSRAAIKSMEARFRKLTAVGDSAAANEYRLIDPQDKTQYASIQYYDDNTLNVCMESTFHFVDKVVDEIAKLHQQAGQPLTIYHIGADETAGAWVDSPVCQAFLESNDKGVASEKDYGAYFIERVSNLLAQKGIKPAGWSDGMSHTRADRMPKVSQSNIWDVVSHDGFKRAHDQANLGWDTVLSNPEVLYFDFPYEADPKEHGYYWASRNSSERKLYSFMPDNLPANAEQWTDIEGRPFEADDTLKLDETGKRISGPLAKDLKFSGIQGQIWSETIRSDDVAEYMIFPRLLVLAERAWHQADWEVPYQYQGAIYNQNSGHFTEEMRAKQQAQWTQFANTLGHKELIKLDRADIAYRVPTVGAMIKDDLLFTNTIYPGLAVEYRVNDGPWQRYFEAVRVLGKVEVRAIAADGQRKGRVLSVN